MSSFSASLPDEKFLLAISGHRFIQLLSTGKITGEQFDVWLAQDSLFVINFVRFAAHVLLNAPRNNYRLLTDGLSTLADELNWFESKLNERHISVKEIQALPSNLNYQRWLSGSIESYKPYLSLLTTFCAIELCYYEVWKSVNNADYQEFTNRWASRSSWRSLSHRTRRWSKGSATFPVCRHGLWNRVLEHAIPSDRVRLPGHWLLIHADKPATTFVLLSYFRQNVSAVVSS